MSAGGVNGPLTWTAAEDHSFVEVTSRQGQRVQTYRTAGGQVGVVILDRKGHVDALAVIDPDALRLLGLVLPEEEPVATEQGDMRPMWTFEGRELRDLLDDLTTGEYVSIRKVRFAVDEDVLKWKINEYTWSAGKDADGEGSR